MIDVHNVKAGAMPKEEMICEITGIMNEAKLDEEREINLGKLIINQLEDEEDEWSKFDFEEDRVKFILGEIIADTLITETVEVLHNLRNHS